MVALGGVHLMGVDMHTATKLLYTLVLVVGLVTLRWIARTVVRLALRGRLHTTGRFWARQGINLATAVVVALGLLSIWFDNGLHAAAAVGLLSAGVAFAMQRVLASFAGYFLILRGDIFTIGDRIVMGGVRGDVIGLGFLRTTILEMGEPVGDQADPPTTWVDARQYTGRIVTVANAVVFDEPVYNYSREFSFLWEEIAVGIPYDADRASAEQVLLDAAHRHSAERAAIAHEAMHRMQRRFIVPATDIAPEVFTALRSSWVELTVRFIVPTRGIRRVKSEITKDILDGLAARGIEIAYETVTVTAPSKAPAATPYPEEPAPARRPSRAKRS